MDTAHDDAAPNDYRAPFAHGGVVAWFPTEEEPVAPTFRVNVLHWQRDRVAMVAPVAKKQTKAEIRKAAPKDSWAAGRRY